MLRRILIGSLLVAALGLSVRAEEKHEHKHTAPAGPKNAQFEQLKKLVGTWVEEKDGKPTEKVVSVMKLVAGGSALQETIFPGDALEMLSVYTVEGNDVVLTHYCVIGNQPRMKADPKSPAGTIHFQFAGGNLDPKKDMHMHGAKLKLIDADHIEIEGEGWDKGEPTKEMCGTMKLVRKK